MAQLGSPDMRLPIQYALYYPERRYLPGERLDFTKLRSIEIDEPDMDTFRGLPLAIRAAKEGGSTPTVFNASNEEAVALFLDHRIGFLDIYRIIEEAMDRHRNIESPDLGQILAVEAETRRRISEEWK